MGLYQIIDEPKIKPATHLIVDPIVILLVSIFVPIFWNPPFMGKFWLPFVWIIFNGYLLGSPTIKKELVVIVLGILAMVGVFFGGVYLSLSDLFSTNPKIVYPYLRIFIQGILFVTLYIVVFMQYTPYSIYKYLKEQANL